MYKIITIAIWSFIIGAGNLFAQTLLNENFSYATGALTSANSGSNTGGGNWTTLTGNTSNLQVAANSLAYSGYGSSSIGNSVTMVSTTASAEDAYRGFASKSINTIYCAMLLNVSDTIGLSLNTSANGDYFTGFLPLTGTSNFMGRILIRKGTAGNTYQLGIRGNANSTSTFSAKDLDVNTTHLVVFAYTFLNGTANDSTLLWINPDLTNQPVYDAGSKMVGSDATDISRVFLRQGNLGTPNAKIDGIHVGLGWSDIMGTDIGPLAPANTITIPSNGLNNVNFKWNRPGDYNPATMQTIAFVKKASAVTQGIPTYPTSSYISNTDFNGSSSLYQNDSLAKCVFNGDTNFVNITGLTSNTFYYLLVYIVRNPDTVYSNPTTSSGTTQANKPASITNINFSSTSFTNTTINFVKPPTYLDSSMTVLVFLKQGAPMVTTGTYADDPSIYTANSDFSGNGSYFVKDSTAKCVYKGDGSSVTVTGLLTGLPYYASAYVVRTTDSSYYSNVLNAAVSTLSQPVAVTGVNFNATGQNTATINWTKPVAYSNTTMSTLVFVKKSDAIATVTYPNKNLTGYIPNTDFTLNGTLFVHDSLAKCMMNSDSGSVKIFGLELATNYHILVYLVRNQDSVYSLPVTASGTTFGLTLPPNPLVSVKLKQTGTQTATAIWKKDTSYKSAEYTTLIFLKEGTAVTQGSPSFATMLYQSNVNFKLGSNYQFDSNAHCVYKGNDTMVMVTGLNPAKTYYLLSYVVRNADSSYSTALTTVASTASLPVSDIVFIGQTSVTTKLTWTKPAGYVNAGYTTLVFLKADSAIVSGNPTRNVISYGANPTFGWGSKYQHDSNAYCVFRADTNFVNLSSIIQNKTYHALIYIVQDIDSVYSEGITGSGGSLPPAPLTNISSINKINPITGVPDSLNVRVRLRGLVYGFNQTNSGLKFLIKDATGGITAGHSTKIFGYLVAEGDSVEIQGNITSNRGLLMVSLDTMQLFTHDNTIKQPVIATKLNEATENNYIRINKVKFLSPQTGNWTSITYPAIVDGTTDTISIRIISTSSLPGKLLPTSRTFDIIGVGGQQSSSTVAPYLFNGYYIIPHTIDDIIPTSTDSLLPFTLLNPVLNGSFDLSGDPSNAVVFNWSKAVSTGTLQANYVFELDTLGGDFSTPKISASSNNSGNDTNYTMSKGALSLALGLYPSSTYKAIWRVNATMGTYSRYANQNFSVVLNRSNFTGIEDLLSKYEIFIYPNPATDKVHIQHSQKMNALQIMDVTGRIIVQIAPNANLWDWNTTTVERGFYFITIETESGNETYKIQLR